MCGVPWSLILVRRHGLCPGAADEGQGPLRCRPLRGSADGARARARARGATVQSALHAGARPGAGRQRRSGNSLIASAPTFEPSAEDVPPRFVSLVSEAKKRLLPSIARQTFAEAREQFERRSGRGAEEVRSRRDRSRRRAPSRRRRTPTTCGRSPPASSSWRGPARLHGLHRRRPCRHPNRPRLRKRPCCPTRIEAGCGTGAGEGHSTRTVSHGSPSAIRSEPAGRGPSDDSSDPIQHLGTGKPNGIGESGNRHGWTCGQCVDAEVGASVV